MVSFISFFTIVPCPEDSKFLKPEEKEVLLARLEADEASVKEDGIDITEAMRDWKIWVAYVTPSATERYQDETDKPLSILVYFGAEANASSVVNFQPTVLKGLGYTSAAAQIHTIPVYATALVFSLTCAFLADWLRQRNLFGMVGAVSTTIGLAVEIGQPKRAAVRYMGMFFLCAGPYIIMPIMVVWLAINLGKGYKRTMGLGALIGFGNCGAFVSSNVFLTKETPTFHTGCSVGLRLNMLCVVGMTALYIGLRLENRRKESSMVERPMTLERVPVEDSGEKHPDFRYEL